MQVRLAVYDMLRREVAVLVEERETAGWQTVAFDGRGLPAGVYVARLQLDHLRFTKRLGVTR